jgi:isocitrate/isopropylmalate dehydrogenase
MTHNIALIKGDGIGPEIMNETCMLLVRNLDTLLR